MDGRPDVGTPPLSSYHPGSACVQLVWRVPFRGRLGGINHASFAGGCLARFAPLWWLCDVHAAIVFLEVQYLKGRLDELEYKAKPQVLNLQRSRKLDMT